MMVVDVAWLWLALALGCVLGGLVLTGKRLGQAPSAPSKTHVRVHRLTSDGSRAGQLCTRCAQPLEAGARFCGSCGLALPDPRRAHAERTRLSRQA